MLCLSRRVNQRIMIGDKIEIVVVEIRGDKVRLGISAPGMPIDREEIHQAKKFCREQEKNNELLP